MSPTTHTSFTLERRLPASPDAVFAAWADPVAKRRWSDCHADAPENEYSLDFRPGGEELSRVVQPDGSVQVVRKRYFDVTPALRTVFAYDIEVGGRRLSVSLVTVEFRPDPAGTLMTYVEQLAYLDGHYDLDERIHGTAEGLDRLVLEFSAGGAVQ